MWRAVPRGTPSLCATALPGRHPLRGCQPAAGRRCPPAGLITSGEARSSRHSEETQAGWRVASSFWFGFHCATEKPTRCLLTAGPAALPHPWARPSQPKRWVQLMPPLGPDRHPGSLCTRHPDAPCAQGTPCSDGLKGGARSMAAAPPCLGRRTLTGTAPLRPACSAPLQYRRGTTQHHRVDSSRLSLVGGTPVPPVCTPTSGPGPLG